MLKNRVRRHLFNHGYTISAKDVSSRLAGEQIAALALPALTRQLIGQCQQLIKQLDRRIATLEELMRRSCAGVKMVELLRTISGIGPIWSAVIYAEVVDIKRFRSGAAFASYTGLVPSVRQSGDSYHTGQITHQGSRPLRTALVEAAISAYHHSRLLHDLYYRVFFKQGFQTARVAVAHKLALIIYAMLTRGEPFRADAVLCRRSKG
jgi:transposase